MNRFARLSVWFNRVVLAGATILFSLIGTRYIVDPVAAVAPHRITLGSSEAVTMMRVCGGVFLGIAGLLLASLFARRRLFDGIAVLAVISIVVTAVRLFGLVIDGSAPFTLRVLKPEVALVVLSSIGFVFERRRLRGVERGRVAYAGLPDASKVR
jgi:Domain of unknown function (DUF4345)